MKHFLVFFTLLLAVSCVQAKPAKNIIFVVADGMGPAYTSAFRYFADDPQTKPVEATIFDELLVGSASTYPDSGLGVVTDSAAAATALSAGVKTYNGAIAVDVNKQPVTTVLEMAKARGMKTGIAVTSQIVHATPAAFLVHNESRKNYDAIADAYFDDRIDGAFKADVMLGGGWQYFKRPERDLIAEFVAAGFNYVDDLTALDSAKVGKPVLGLFADIGLPWALDSRDQPRLKAMTQAAVKHLENKKGYFLLVEASQVDWAGHANDIGAAMAEMADLSDTLHWLKDYVEGRNDTLMVVTADHSTGGLTLGADSQYLWRPGLLHRLPASPDGLAKQTLALESDQRAAWLGQSLAVTLDDSITDQLADIDDPQAMSKLIKQLIDRETHTGWTTGGHTGVDVPVLAIGRGAQHFAGFQDNTDIAKKLIDMVK